MTLLFNAVLVSNGDNNVNRTVQWCLHKWTVKDSKSPCGQCGLKHWEYLQPEVSALCCILIYKSTVLSFPVWDYVVRADRRTVGAAQLKIKLLLIGAEAAPPAGCREALWERSVWLQIQSAHQGSARGNLCVGYVGVEGERVTRQRMRNPSPSGGSFQALAKTQCKTIRKLSIFKYSDPIQTYIYIHTLRMLTINWLSAIVNKLLTIIQ